MTTALPKTKRMRGKLCQIKADQSDGHYQTLIRIGSKLYTRKLIRESERSLCLLEEIAMAQAILRVLLERQTKGKEGMRDEG